MKKKTKKFIPPFKSPPQKNVKKKAATEDDFNKLPPPPVTCTKYMDCVPGNHVKSNQILTETIARQDRTLDRLHDLTFNTAGHPDGLQGVVGFGPHLERGPSYHLNPYNKKNHQHVIGKILTREPPGGFEPINEHYLSNVQHCSKLPIERNQERRGTGVPETTNQEFGWFTRFIPTINRDPRIDYSKRLTDVSSYMDIYWGYYPPAEAKFHARSK